MNKTSTTITFVTQTLGDGAGSSTIAVELDTAKNGNKSQFASGDTVHLKIYTSPLTMPISAASSAGAVTIGQTATGDITEILTFANEKAGNLRFLGNSITSFRWFGNNLGAPVLNGNQVTIPAAGIGALEITYKASYREGNLSGVSIPAGLNEFPVVVVFSEQAA
jgi:hypothetical protein